MNYIYDIILNFNDVYYDIYEWKSDDNIINIRKIPFIKVNENDFLALKYNDIKLEQDCLSKLKGNLSVYDDDIKGNIILLVTNGKATIGVMFDEDGVLLKRSSMLFDEEDEVNEEARRVEELKLKYIYNKKRTYDNMTRMEREKKKTLKDFINRVVDKMTLKYLYYDYFLVECDDIVEMKSKLNFEIDNNFSDKLDELYNVIMLLKKVNE